MNITEANSWNRVVDALSPEATPEQRELAVNHAAYLAGRARKALGAGPGQGRVGRLVGHAIDALRGER